MSICFHQGGAQLIRACPINCERSSYVYYGDRLRWRGLHHGLLLLLWITILLLLLRRHRCIHNWLRRRRLLVLLLHEWLWWVLHHRLRFLLLLEVYIWHLHLIVHRHAYDHVVAIFKSVWLTWIDDSYIVLLSLIFLLLFFALIALETLHVSHDINILKSCV